MKNNAKIMLGVAAIAYLLASPAFAGKVSLDDKDLSKVTGMANTFTFGDAADSTISNGPNSNADISFGWVQWSDNHSDDASNHKGANDQSGSNSAVQQNVLSSVNNLAWGAIGQSALVNSGKVTLNGPERNIAYGVIAVGGF